MTKGRSGHVLATVLFTDIVDSSRHARDLGDRRWRVLLDRHHDIVRRTLKRWGGREIDNAGDGFFAAFEDPADAIRCACEVSDELRTLGIEVRAGCHIGQAEIIGRKLGGVTVHAGARVMTEAGASEVLVSGMLKDLVPAAGFGFADRGEHELKGIDGVFYLFAVTSVDGQPRPGPLDPDEAARLLDEVEPPPIHRRRSWRAAIAFAGVLLIGATAFFVVSRPDPIEIKADSLVRIDPATNEVVADVPVSKPGGAQLAVVPPNELWVLSQPEQVISIVDADTTAVIDRVPLQSGQTANFPLLTGYGIVYGWDEVWVAPREPSDRILGFDPTFRNSDRSYRLDGNTGRLATGGGLLWVPLAGGAPTWRLEGVDPQTGKVEVKATTGQGSYNVGYGEGSVWVTNHYDASVTKVDPETGEADTIDLGGVGEPSGIGFGFQSVWVSDALNGVVYRIDPATGEIVDTIEIAGITTGFQSDVVACAGSIWVTNTLTKSIVRIDPSTNDIIARILVPYAPQDLIVGYGSVWTTVVSDPQ